MSTSVYETRSVEKTSRWTEALIWTAQLNGTERLELNMCAIGEISNSFNVFLSCCPTGLQKYKPTPVNSERHTSILFSSEADTNESHCATATKGASERSSGRAVSAPDSRRHLGTIGGEFACGKTYCRRRCRFRPAARPRWPRSGPARHSGSWRRSRQTQRLWPDLWFQTDLHGQPDGAGTQAERRWQTHRQKKRKRKAKHTITKSMTRTLTLCK